MSVIDTFKRGRQRYSMAKLWAYLAILETALVGDMVLSCSPATKNSSKAVVAAAIAGAAGKYVRTVTLYLKNAAGDIQTWYNGSMNIAVAEVTAGDGTSAIAGGANHVHFVEGVASVDIEYIGSWDDGVAQVESCQVTGGAVTASGTITISITGAGIAGSPVEIPVEVTLNDAAADIADLIAVEINNNAAVYAKYSAVAGGAGLDTIILTKKAPFAANDGTLAIGFTDTDTTGVTMGASGNTTAGVAPDTQTLTVTGGTILGTSITDKTSVDTIVA